ncbi:NADP-dependent oxidoreductase domain-containing protein [Mariannaea sp. PMI_226]|nr:NADP-dependent oxidoreductase domain-containing protein [Mariannaea sp. PMI_226]
MAATPKSPLNLIGDKSRDPIARFDTPEEVNSVLNALAARGYHQIDTARMYSPHAPGSSESRIGAVNAGDRFAIDTKVLSVEPGSHAKEKVLKEIDTSLEQLNVKQINIEYLHFPDRATKFEEPCEAMDQAHMEGKIKHWGISNFTAEEVQKVVDICQEHGFVMPSVYQGQYNLVARSGEKELFPILRKYGISFYAYSPAAAGFFAGNHKNVQAGGRYDQSHFLGGLYTKTYLQPRIIDATDNALAVASKHGISGHAAALRWTAYHSVLSKEHGDSIILGASSPGQLESNIDMIEQGPLPDDVVAALEAVYAETGDQIPYHK